LLLFKFKPRTPGTRIKSATTCLNIYNKKHSFFFFKKTKKSGRFFSGLITTRHRKNAKNFFTFSFKNFLILKKTIGIVVSFFFLKNSKYFSLIKYSDGSFSILPATSNIFLGSYFFFYFSPFFYSFVKPSYLVCTFLYLLSPSTLISFISSSKFFKAKYCRSAGTYSQVNFLSVEKNFLQVTLPSGLKKNFNIFCSCFIGRSANELKKFVIKGKASVNVLLGVRPTVRGNAMNPIDHPHGGRTKTNQPEVSPWGWVAKHNK